ncbi:MAG: 2-C-methyl-D-erythritol 4-phosphate cytidylyltransferase [Gammaproteobacteria bacterium]
MSPTSRTRVHALIPAAGRGERLGGVLPKQYQVVAGKPRARARPGGARESPPRTCHHGSTGQR